MRWRFQEWTIPGGATSDVVLRHFEAAEAAKEAGERKKEERKQARENTQAKNEEAGRVLLAAREATPLPAPLPDSLSSEKCLQVRAALRVKVTEKAPKVEALRGMVADCFRNSSQAVAAPPFTALLPRGVLPLLKWVFYFFKNGVHFFIFFIIFEHFL
jgi:hypothetical protein